MSQTDDLPALPAATLIDWHTPTTFSVSGYKKDQVLAYATAARAPLLARIAELEAALRGLDDAYCRAGTRLTREERHEDRLRLIAARAALKGKP